MTDDLQKPATEPRELNRRTAICATLIFIPASGAVFAQSNPQDLLATTDQIRNPDRPFFSKVTLIEFMAGRQVDTSVLKSWSRPNDGAGQFQSLIAFAEPARDAGKLMLKTGNDLWFFDPSTKATIRISPQQRLMGQAANGDVVTVNLAKDYDAVSKGTEEVTDGERKTRNAYHLALTAKSPSATYASIELWVDVDNSRPLRARFYAESGRLLKTVFYRRWQTQVGRERPTETVIIDGLNPQSVTLIRLSDYSTPSIPAAWFNRDNLPRFQPD